MHHTSRSSAEDRGKPSDFALETVDDALNEILNVYDEGDYAMMYCELYAIYRMSSPSEGRELSSRLSILTGCRPDAAISVHLSSLALDADLVHEGARIMRDAKKNNVEPEN